MSEAEHQNGVWNPLDQLIETNSLQQETLVRHEGVLTKVQDQQEQLRVRTNALKRAFLQNQSAIKENQEMLSSLQSEGKQDSTPSLKELQDELNLTDQLNELFQKGLDQSSKGLELLEAGKDELVALREERSVQKVNAEEIQLVLDRHLITTLLLVGMMGLLCVLATVFFLQLRQPSPAQPKAPVSLPSPQNVLHSSNAHMSEHERKVAQALIAKSQGLPLNTEQRRLLQHVNQLDPKKNGHKRRNKRAKSHKRDKHRAR